MKLPLTIFFMSCFTYTLAVSTYNNNKNISLPLPASKNMANKKVVETETEKRGGAAGGDGRSYQPWTAWGACDKRCRQTRQRQCRSGQVCSEAVQEETRPCSRADGKRCQEAIRTTVEQHLLQQQTVTASNGTNNKTTDRKVESAFFDLLYSPWSTWSVCNRACKRSRYRTCRVQRLCRNTMLLEERRCYTAGSRCQKQQAGTGSAAGTGKNKADRKPEDFTTAPVPETLDDEQYSDDSNMWLNENEHMTDAPKLPEVPVCGRRAVDERDLRIVGGKEAAPGSWDWQAAIMTPWHEQFCGGVLVAPRWVLTAAHCVMKNGRKRKVVVRLGDHNLRREDKREDTVKVEKSIVHPKFNLETVDSDLALLMLARPVKKTTKPRYVCVPHGLMEEHFPEGTACQLLGWGKLHETHATGTHILREATVPLVDRQKCVSAFDYAITGNQFCGGYDEGGVDTCTGDSGGPLLCEAEGDGERRWYVYGITSFGEGCGERGKYGVYTKVSQYFEWISNTISKHGKTATRPSLANQDSD